MTKPFAAIITFILIAMNAFSQNADSAFSDINKAFLSPLKVKFLDLSNQDLKTIPDSTSKFKNLKVLNLSGNADLNFEKIFSDLSQCKNLKVLYLDGNKLKTLPAEIGEISSLQELYLRNNRIVSLPNAIANLKLKNLDLGNNHMSDETALKLYKLIPNETIVNTNDEAGDKNEAIKYYEEGNKAANMGRLALADSLYTVSINISPDNNSYFNRAVVRKKMHDQKGYCLDLGTASGLNDHEATKLYWKDCGSVDTVFYDRQDSVVKKGAHASLAVVSKSKYTTYMRYKKMELSKKIIVHFEVLNDDTIFYVTPNPPKYPESEENITAMLYKNVVPTEAEKGSLPLTYVLVSFNVLENGEIANILATSALEKTFTDRLVVALRKNIKKWQPAMYENRPVKYKKYINYKLILKSN
ncbi:MAG: hypothetical protein K0Q95_435 [Bacteroidota bacterium]|jgi:tetratricopeptide (TPR) repeat protein|nr:hypothetical protein [Bacteroidota bacterium]